jgi:hypothetical protein
MDDFLPALEAAFQAAGIPKHGEVLVPLQLGGVNTQQL